MNNFDRQRLMKLLNEAENYISLTMKSCSEIKDDMAFPNETRDKIDRIYKAIQIDYKEIDRIRCKS